MKLRDIYSHSKRSHRFWLFSLIFAFSLFILPQAYSQEGSDAQEVFELSPFEVEAGSDVGYSASQTTLGGRMRQEIRDIPTQIEVFTQEMIDDFGITSLDDAFRYSINIENYDEFIAPDDGAAIWSGKELGRIRGLNPSSFSTSRNLLSSITKTDSYNVERFVVGSGAQSIILSLGEPAGVANIALKTAKFRDFGEIEASVDSEDGYRFVLDVNEELVDDKLAIRFAYLNEDNPGFLKPSYNTDKRWYGTLTVKPFKSTTIRFHVEDYESMQNRAFQTFPYDFASPSYDAIQSGNVENVVTDTFGGIRSMALIPSGDNEHPLPLYHYNQYQNVVGPGEVEFDPINFGPGAADPNSGVARVTFGPEDFEKYPELEASIGKNLLGELVQLELESKIYNLFVEQRITDTLHVEFGAHKEEWQNKQQTALGANRVALYADVNQVISSIPFNSYKDSKIDTQIHPDDDPAQAALVEAQNFMLNPNFGKTYAIGQLSANIFLEETEEWRASIAWDPEVPENFSWLGDHSFLASYNSRESWDMNSGVIPKMQGALDYQGFSGADTSTRRRVGIHHYYDAGENATFQLPTINGVSYTVADLFNGFTLTEPTTGQVIEVAGWDSPGNGKRPVGWLQEIDSIIAAWQASFWNNRIILNYGFRRDDVYRVQNNQQTNGEFSNKGPWDWWQHDDPEFIWWDYNTEEETTADSMSYGAVIRPLSWLSFSYYQGETFSFPTGQFTAFGETIPGSEGESKEYAVRVDSTDGRYYLKLNYYEVLRYSEDIGGLTRQNAAFMEDYYMKIIDEINEADPTQPTYEELLVQQGITAPGAYQRRDFSVNSAYHPIVGDILSHGTEITGGAHWGNFNVRLTFAYATTKKVNVSSDWPDWIASRLPFWSSVVDINGDTWDVIPARSGKTMKEWYEDDVLSALNAAVQKNDQPVDTGRKYRVNVNVSYDFRDGVMKNWRVGGAARWRSAPIIGFPAEASENIKPNGYPIAQLDLDNPYKGDEEFDIDLFVRYSGKNFLGTKMNYRVQFNVRNLLTGDNEYRTGKVNAFGKSIHTIIEVPRSYQLSLDLLF